MKFCKESPSSRRRTAGLLIEDIVLTSSRYILYTIATTWPTLSGWLSQALNWVKDPEAYHSLGDGATGRKLALV